MNTYIYSVDEIGEAFRETIDAVEHKFPKRLRVDCGSHLDPYRFYNLNWTDQTAIIYPSGSMWNHELVGRSFNKASPIDADYFAVPVSILYGDDNTPRTDLAEFEEIVLSEFCYRLPYWQYHRDRHVFFIVGDSYRGPHSLEGSIILRTSCDRRGKDIPLHFDVYLDRTNVRPISECENRCAFVGCLDTHPMRRHLPVVINSVSGGIHMESTPNFFCVLPEAARKMMQKKWVEVLQNSQFILSPRGCGLNSIRFFEALSFGRIPILIADDAKLPLEDEIDYDEFVVRVPEKKMRSVPLAIDDFYANHDLGVASRIALMTWEEYFSGGKFYKYLERCLPKAETDKRHKLV